MDIIQAISKDLNISDKKVEAAVKLLDEGNTVPFIARYRKEVTGYLTDEDLRNLSEKLSYLRKLQERAGAIISSIKEQGKLTEELFNQIEASQTLSELEDLYRPYKPKRKTKASIAKEKGLQSLADYLRIGKNTKDIKTYASSFISDEKKVLTYQDALQGAEDIIAEDISDQAKYRKYIKDLIRAIGLISSKEIKKDEKDTYFQYKDYKEPIRSIPPHRILALNRGEKEGCLRINISYDYDSIFNYLAKDYIGNNYYAEYLNMSLADSLKRLILPSVENEIRTDLTTFAEDKSIEVFKKNLYSLLMYPPLKNKRILGFDPGFRTGCKYAVVNKNGVPEKVGVVYITSDKEDEKAKAREDIKALLKVSNIDYIALGNGTASRESELELRNIISQNNFKCKVQIVNESGASVYSASELGQEEFPDLPVEKRSAISLARRLQDPLSELVKIDPKSIGVGQYQHDMDQVKLNESLHGVVENCVNTVGVNLNNSSMSLLKYVSGINSTLAVNVYNYIKEFGMFKNRAELKKVEKMGPKAFEQCAGFLRIYGGDEPLDTTAVHPESYKLAKEILKICNIDLLKDDEALKKEKLKQFNKEDFLAKHISADSPTIDDIVDEIVKPGRDIRDEVKIVELNNEATDISQLKVGMILEGTVRNIMDFGMFVDINVHQDGLVHISEIANHYVKNISDLYSIGDVVKVKVISVDEAKKRIGLSIKALSNSK
jgi:uncharacterized protein